MTTSHDHLICFYDHWYAYQMVGFHIQCNSNSNICFRLLKHQFISSEVNSLIKRWHKKTTNVLFVVHEVWASSFGIHLRHLWFIVIWLDHTECGQASYATHIFRSVLIPQITGIQPSSHVLHKTTWINL